MSRFAFVVLSSLSLLGCWNEIDGGAEISKERTLESFSKVRVESGLTVKIAPGSPSATITAPEKVEEHLQTLRIEGTLVVRIRPGVRVTNLESTEVVIRGENLEQVEAIKGSEVNFEGVTATTFRALAAGGSRVVVTGATPDLRVEASGGSTIIATGVNAESVSIAVAGGSTVEVNSTRAVGGVATGGSTVRVSGPGDFSTIYATDGSTVSAQ